jgi:hypothetical protein
MQTRANKKLMHRTPKGISGWLALFSIRTKTIKMRMPMILMK